MNARNTAIVAALREVGAFADQPGTPGVNVPIAATACELDPWNFVRSADGSYRLAATFPLALDPAHLASARDTGLPLDELAQALYARLSAALAQVRGRALVAWAGLAQSMRDVLTVMLIASVHRWEL